MKCPKCNGKGDYFNEVYNDGKRRREILIKCNKCNGTGEVQMTNEEWLRSCTTEQLAEFIYCLIDACDYYAGNGAKKISQYAKEDANDKKNVELIHGNRDFDELVEWLKQPHHD